jgi:hypothetical protein
MFAEPRTYRVCDTIEVELKLEDESGIGAVYALFRNTSTNDHLYMEGHGGGRTRATVSLTKEVTDRIRAGEYVCEYVSVSDTRGNSREHRRELRFRVDTPPSDFEGPNLKDARVK